MKLDLANLLNNPEIQDPLLEVLVRLRDKCKNGEQLDKLSTCEKTIYLVGELETGINSVGFSTYHFNSSGKHAHETLEALKQIKSKHVYKLLKKSIRIYGKGPTNDGRFGSKEKEELTERQENKLNKLDDEFYEYKEDIYQLQMDYIQLHMKQFDL